jgi:hypothetical protein
MSSLYQERASNPANQAAMLAALDRLSTQGPPYGRRICTSLHVILKDAERINPYAFVANHSDYYEAFRHLPQDDCWGDDGSEADLFRRNWCRNMAAALRADPGLWLKETE